MEKWGFRKLHVAQRMLSPSSSVWSAIREHLRELAHGVEHALLKLLGEHCFPSRPCSREEYVLEWFKSWTLAKGDSPHAADHCVIERYVRERVDETFGDSVMASICQRWLDNDV